MKSLHYYPCSTVEETGTQELNPFTPGHAASTEVRELDWNLASLQLRVYTLLFIYLFFLYSYCYAKLSKAFQKTCPKCNAAFQFL